MNNPNVLATIQLPDTTMMEERIRAHFYERVTAAARKGAEQAIADATAAFMGEAPSSPATGPVSAAAHKTPAKPPRSVRKPARRRSVPQAAPVDEEAVLGAIRAHADSRGPRVGDVAKALKTDVSVVRPLLAKLRDAGRARTTGRKQGTRYKAVA